MSVFMFQLLVRHPSSCGQTVFQASFWFCQIASLVTLLRDVLARMGKETLDTFPGLYSCYKSPAFPLSSLDAFDKTLRALRRARPADWEAVCFVNSGVFSQTLFHKDWVFVRVGFCVRVIEGSRTAEGHPSQAVARRVELRRSSNLGGVPD